ncbi:MAG: endonuclease/exonuclease/phosphatase family protein [Cytophagales bacterium]|nr:endonuclease/exonuclease/phosphatase family protein [Cytophagales bacterium]
MKKIIIVFIILLGTLTACDPFNTQFDEVTKVKYYNSVVQTETTVKDTLSIATWNIKFGGARLNFFFDCLGDRSVMTKEEVERNLDKITEKINQVNPDVLLLQEVDVLSKRSQYFDMMEYLLNRTNLNYGVYTSQWKADYIPSSGIGKMNSGNAILSKYPLSSAERIALPLIEEQSEFTQYFYLKRNILKVKTLVGEKELYLLNTHLTAYGGSNIKEEQLSVLSSVLDELKGKYVVFGGDLNTLPPHTYLKKDFADNVCPVTETDDNNYEGEEEFLSLFYDNYQAAVPLENYKARNELYFTHSIDQNVFWNRKLDYLFTNQTFIKGTDITHQNISQGGTETMSLSDHTMISVEFEF